MANMNPEVKRCLAILDKLTGEKGNRLLELLSCSEAPSNLKHPYEWPEWCQGWAFNVGPQFANALDIHLTQRVVDKKPTKCWTQGSTFDFKAGYAVHTYLREMDDKKWIEQLAQNPVSIKIEAASPAIPKDESGTRNKGTVRFQILKRSPDGKTLVQDEIFETTQEGFIRYLITGVLQ